MADRFILLNEKIMEWEWFDDVYVYKLFTCMLLMASYKDTDYKGIHLKRGSFVTSIDDLSKRTLLSQKSIKNSLKKLVSTGEIIDDVKPNKYRIITIVNYDKYQTVGSSRTNKGTNKRTNRRTDKRTNKGTNNGTTINKDIYTPKGVYISDEKKKAASPARLEGGGLTAEELTYPIIRDFARSIGSNDYIAADFHTAFERSKTYFPPDWQDIFSRMIKADSGVCENFLKDVKAGAYRKKWGSY